MKKTFIYTIALLYLNAALAQNFPGFRAGNYTGVNGVFFNPANIADSRYKWDVNLVSANVLVNNTNASFNLNHLSQSLNSDSLKNLLYGNGQSTTGNVNLDIFGPSAMFNVGEKSTFAVSTRVRTIANIVDMDGTFYNKLINSAGNNTNLPFTTNTGTPMKTAINSWAEFGLSWGRVLVSEGNHFLKGGITAKYLAGATAASVGISNFKSTLNYDPSVGYDYLTNTTGNLNINLGGGNISNPSASDLLKFNGRGVGFDLGFVYEYRPDAEKYKVKDGSVGAEQNKYKFKLGIAITDIGSMSYNVDTSRSSNYSVNIPAEDKFYTPQLLEAELDGIKTLFQKYPQYFASQQINNGKMKMGMPTTLQIDADFHLQKGFYIAGAAQVALTSKSDMNSISNYSSYSLTPRYEGRKFGFYLPLSTNSITGINAGFSVRMGPVFIGSGSVITALLGNSKQADVHFGLRMGGLKHKAPKIKKA